MKMAEKLTAIRLRKHGKSYKEILNNINVSKSTLSLWLRDVPLSEKNYNRIFVTLRQKNANRLAKANQQKRIQITKQIIVESIDEFKTMMDNPLFLPGLMLYWAEGDKTETNEVVKLSNSDPAMIKFMMKWFREICKVPENKFRIALHIHTLHCRKNITKYWSKLTNIPLKQFYKTQVKPTSLKHRRNPLYDGTCSVVIYERNLFRKIKGWKFGFKKRFNLIEQKMAPSFNG